jgi:hypothetical protein
VPIATIHVLEGRYDERRARAGISPDDLLIQLSEAPGENFSFGQGLAQRAFISAGTVADGDVPITPASVNGEERG